MKLPLGQRFRIFLIRLRSWEYWPFGILQAPLFFQWLWYALRSGSFFYFSASNPGILTGGMMGESKAAVLNLIPEHLRPATCLVRRHATLAVVADAMNTAGITYPCVFKPDIGERGWMVRIIRDESQANQYLKEVPCDFLIQAYVQLPLEFGVFFIRMPDEERGRVVSVTGKKMLAVTGDGRSTLGALVFQNDRALLQAERMYHALSHRWSHILPSGEVLTLNPIGNHCLGTCFLDACHVISPEMDEAFNRIAEGIAGFYFGRFDLRCASVEDLQAGRVQIMELNGCGAEPSHIYQPGFPLTQAMRTLFRHMRDMFEISRKNHERGVPYLGLREGLDIFSAARKTMNRKTTV